MRPQFSLDICHLSSDKNYFLIRLYCTRRPLAAPARRYVDRLSAMAALSFVDGILIGGADVVPPTGYKTWHWKDPAHGLRLLNRSPFDRDMLRGVLHEMEDVITNMMGEVSSK